MNRRFFLLAAPAIVAAPSLMRVSAIVMPSAVIGETVIWIGQSSYHFSPEVINQALRTNALLQWAQDRAFVESISGVSDLMRGAQYA